MGAARCTSSASWWRRRAGERGSEFERSEELSDVGFIASEAPDFSTFWRGQRDGSRSFSRDAAGKLMATEDLTTTRKRKTATEEFGNAVTSQLEWSFTPVAGDAVAGGITPGRAARSW